MTVDINPDLTRIGDPAGYPVLFGDAEDPELSTTLPLERVQWVISTAREKRANLTLLHSLKQQGYTGRTAITAQFDNDVAELEQAGADIVLSPFSDAACEAADRITEADLT